jgi:hypothetical protein
MAHKASTCSKAYQPLSDHECEPKPSDEVFEGHQNGYSNLDHGGRDNRLTYSLYTIALLLTVLCAAVLALHWRFEDLLASTNSGPTSLSITHSFTTSIGRDTRFMSTDHNRDSLWDVMLQDRLGTFDTPGEEFEEGEYSM